MWWLEHQLFHLIYLAFIAVAGFAWLALQAAIQKARDDGRIEKLRTVINGRNALAAVGAVAILLWIFNSLFSTASTPQREAPNALSAPPSPPQVQSSRSQTQSFSEQSQVSGSDCSIKLTKLTCELDNRCFWFSALQPNFCMAKGWR